MSSPCHMSLIPTSAGFVELHSAAASAKDSPNVRLGDLGFWFEFGNRFSTLGFPTVLRCAES